MPRNDLIQMRSDTAANWASVNPTLAVGEIGFETDTGKFKIGASTTRTYAIGDIGPGGGKIFITPSTAGNSTGKYFEVAPVGVEVVGEWATGGNQSLAVSGADGTAIGTGAQNTIDIVAQAGNVAATSAAVYCSELTYGGKSDWFLPSKDELNQMYVNRDALGTNLSDGVWWSSSEYSAIYTWLQLFNTGDTGPNAKNTTVYARPVRSFTVGMGWDYTDYAVTPAQTFTYKVGDTGPGGGTIFFVDRFNEYADFTYLELAPSSTQTLRTWAPSTPTNYQNLAVTGADSKALGAGYQNTIDIVAQGHTNPATSAARYCSDLVSGGQSDWYLPSVGEMKMICEVAYLQLGITTLLVDTYWTSSETSGSHAWYVNFISTEITQVVKSANLRVRAIRRFSENNNTNN